MGENPSVLLLRHGETEWNRIGRLQGRDDSPLTARGQAQAASLARLAVAFRVQRVWSSPLGRARSTARVIAEACSVPIETHDELMEIDFGHCSGGTLAEAEARFPGFLARRQSARWTEPWPGGESYADVLERVAPWLARVGELRTDPPTLIVAHQSLHRALQVAMGVVDIERALMGAQSADEVFRVTSAGEVDVLRVGAESPTH